VECLERFAPSERPTQMTNIEEKKKEEISIRFGEWLKPEGSKPMVANVMKVLAE